MAKRTASAKKQARAGARRTVRNRSVKSEIKTLVVKARRSIADKNLSTDERIGGALEAIRSLDRAASKSIVHRNNAARRKSRLARQLAKLAGAAPPPASRDNKKNVKQDKSTKAASAPRKK